MVDRIYFNIKAGSPAAEPIVAWQKAITAHRLWVKDFAKRHGFADAEWVGMNGVTIVGFAPKRPKELLTGREYDIMWAEFLARHPLWRRVYPRRGSPYVTPRKVSAEEKALAKLWGGRPKIPNAEHIGHEITGLGWSDFMEGRTLYHVGWRIRKDDSILFVVPYFATKREGWKPLKGLKRGSQDRLRDEWEAK